MSKLSRTILIMGFGLTLSACGGGDPSATPSENLAQTNATPQTAQRADFRTVAFTNGGSGDHALEVRDWEYNAETQKLSSAEHSFDYTAPADASTVEIVNPAIDGYILNAYIGTPANAEDVPTKIGATYSGDAQGTLDITSATSLSDFSGKSQISIEGDSSAITADLRIYDVEKVSSSDTTALAFDEITLSGLTLNGTSLSGGDLVILQNGSEVTPIGTNTTDDALAEFFGPDAETIAGHLVSSSSQGMLHARYETSMQP